MISVAIAAYNGARFIERQLESIRLQTVLVDEVIICDDGSTDGTPEICRAFIEKHRLAGWRVECNPQNVGYCLNFYGAVRQCGGDLIFLADQDDLWYPDKVKRMTETLNTHPEIAVLGSRYDVIDADDEPISLALPYLGDRFDGSLETVDAFCQIGCSCVRGFSLCFRKSIVPLIPDIDLKSLLSHDWMICSIGALTAQTAILNEKLAGYRYHEDNVSLAAMNKEHRVRRLEKRIRGVEESLAGHRYLCGLTDDEAYRRAADRFIRFEERRLRFLETRNPLRWIALLSGLREYRRYYKDSGLRVWAGDFIYAYKK